MYSQVVYVLVIIASFAPGKVGFEFVTSNGAGGGMVQAAPFRTADITRADWRWDIYGYSLRWRMWWDLPTVF